MITGGLKSLEKLSEHRRSQYELTKSVLTSYADNFWWNFVVFPCDHFEVQTLDIGINLVLSFATNPRTSANSDHLSGDPSQIEPVSTRFLILFGS